MTFEPEVTEADLLESMRGHHAERLAIMAEAGVENRAEAAALDMHSCEVRSVIRMYYPDGRAAAAYFDGVEKARGKEAADKLRNDVRAEWKKRQEQEREWPR